MVHSVKKTTAKVQKKRAYARAKVQAKLAKAKALADKMQAEHDAQPKQLRGEALEAFWATTLTDDQLAQRKHMQAVAKAYTAAYPEVIMFGRKHTPTAPVAGYYPYAGPSNRFSYRYTVSTLTGERPEVAAATAYRSTKQGTISSVMHTIGTHGEAQRLAMISVIANTLNSLDVKGKSHSFTQFSLEDTPTGREVFNFIVSGALAYCCWTKWGINPELQGTFTVKEREIWWKINSLLRKTRTVKFTLAKPGVIGLEKGKELNAGIYQARLNEDDKYIKEHQKVGIK